MTVRVPLVAINTQVRELPAGDTISGTPASIGNLAAFQALTIAADSLTIGTGASAFTQVTFAANTFPAKGSSGNLVAKTISDFGLSLVDDADAAAARTTLGLGTAATHASGDYDAAGAAAAAQAASQPLDSDLTAIAALTTTSYGRGTLAVADAAAFRTYIGATFGTTATASVLVKTNAVGNIDPGFLPLVANALVNGGMDYVQRQVPGTLTTIVTDKYSADRWRTSSQSASLQFQQIDTNGAQESGLSARYYGTWKQITNAGKFAVYQPVEGVLTYSVCGKVVTFQCLLKASGSKTIRLGLLQLSSSGTMDTISGTVVPTWNANTTDPTFATNYTLLAPTAAANGASGTVSGNALSCSVTTAWTLFGATFTIGATTKNIIPVVFTDSQFSANDTLSMSEAGLYEGSGTRPWHEPDPSQELSRVLRYYEKSYADGVAPGTNSPAVYTLYTLYTAAVANALYYINIFFKSYKRILPSVATYSYVGTAGAIANGSGTDLAASSGIASAISSAGFSFYNGSGGNITPSVGGFVGYWTAEAEL